LICFYKNVSAPLGSPPGGVEKSESKKNYESENKKKTNERKKQGSLQSTVLQRTIQRTRKELTALFLFRPGGFKFLPWGARKK
jgi:hypothetical protein